MSDDYDTPVERPEATLPEHRPYVFALTNAVSQLQAVSTRLGTIIHEIRVAKTPIGREKIDDLRDTFEALEQVGATSKLAFSK